MKNFLLLFCTILLASCTSINEVSSTKVDYPNWISSRPVSNEYYIGIAKSSKNNPDYEALAKQNALADLSSEISVNLSSESIFHQVDKGDSYREEYQALIQVESKKNLEGYTRAATWENETEYWLYYQLSKFEWEQIISKRKQQAIEEAFSFYKLANKYAAEDKFVSSVHYAVKALDVLKLYMNESLIHSELEFPLDVLCFEFLADTHSSIIYEMYSGAQNIDVIIMGNTRSLDPIEVSIAKSNVPFKIRSSISGIPSSIHSDKDGLLSVNINNADAYKEVHFVQFSLNWELILRDANASVWLRSLLDFPENSFKVSINTLWPKIAIASEELNLGVPMTQSVLLNETSIYLKKKGFNIVAPINADFLISISSNTTRGLTNNRMHTAMLQYDFVVTNSLGTVVYQQHKMELKGVQASFPTAGVNAYERSIEKFKWVVLREFLKYLEGE